MRMKDPIPTFSYIVEKIKEKHPNLAFVHLIEPRVSATDDRDCPENEVKSFNISREY